MKVLLDTECWLWWLLAPDKLNTRALDVFESRRNPLWLSAASSWEMSIKVSLGKLKLPAAVEAYVPQRLAEDAIEGLPIEHAHALRTATLPSHHQDPFDRLLVAQAQLERMSVLTADSLFLSYDVDVLWAGAKAPKARESRRRSRVR